MILGVVWHLVIFKDLYDSLGIYNRADPIIPLGFASMIIQGVVLAYFYPFYVREQGNSLTRALTYSLTMGLFLFSVSTLANAAKIIVSSMSMWLAIQVAFHLIQFAMAGVLIGLVNKGRSEAK